MAIAGKLTYNVISGTNREGAYSLKIAQYVKAVFETMNQEVNILDLAQLPIQIFHPTSYKTKPQEFSYWQKIIDDSKGLIICVPEYNRGIPGVLKHFLDMLEFPDTLNGKPIALIGASEGSSGAVEPLKQVTFLLNYHKARVFEVKTHIPKCRDVITEEGSILDENIQELISRQIVAFVNFCNEAKDLT